MDPSMAFANLLRDHCYKGTGRTALGLASGAWTDIDLSYEIKRVAKMGTPEIIRKWKKGEHFPKANSKNALTTIFFGTAELSDYNSKNAVERKAFEQAWIAADEAKRLEPALSIGIDAPHPNLEWQILPSPKSNSIAELSVRPPTPTNEPGIISLKVTLVMSLLETDYEGFPVSIGARQVQLLVVSNSYQLVPQSTIVDRLNSTNFKRIADGFDIVGPLDATGRILGEILSDEPLTQLETVGNGTDPIDISLITNRRNFIVDIGNDEDGNQGTTQNKKHVLDALLYSKLKKDGIGRALIASVRIQHRELSKDDL